MNGLNLISTLLLFHKRGRKAICVLKSTCQDNLKSQVYFCSLCAYFCVLSKYTHNINTTFIRLLTGSSICDKWTAFSIPHPDTMHFTIVRVASTIFLSSDFLPDCRKKTVFNIQM